MKQHESFRWRGKRRVSGYVGVRVTNPVLRGRTQTISVPETTYERVRRHALARRVSVKAALEEMIAGSPRASRTRRPREARR